MQVRLPPYARADDRKTWRRARRTRPRSCASAELLARSIEESALFAGLVKRHGTWLPSTASSAKHGLNGRNWTTRIAHDWVNQLDVDRLNGTVKPTLAYARGGAPLRSRKCP
jgi:hypothetical protein